MISEANAAEAIRLAAELVTVAEAQSAAAEALLAGLELSGEVPEAAFAALTEHCTEVTRIAEAIGALAANDAKKTAAA